MVYCTLEQYCKNWFLRRELPAPGLGIHWRNGFLPGIFKSWTRNPLEEWNSAGNYQILDEELAGGMDFCWELPAPRVRIHRKKEIMLGITGSWKWIQTSKIQNLLFNKIPRT
jgi:hypothetical protein